MSKGIGTPIGFPIGRKAFSFSGGIGLGIGDNGASGGEPPPTPPENPYFTDDAKTDAYFTNDAKTNQYFTQGTS